MTSCHFQPSFLFPSENCFVTVPDRLRLRDAELIFDPAPAAHTKAQMTSLLRSNLPDGKPQGLLYGTLAKPQKIVSEAARQAGEGERKASWKEGLRSDRSTAYNGVDFHTWDGHSTRSCYPLKAEGRLGWHDTEPCPYSDRNKQDTIYGGHRVTFL